VPVPPRNKQRLPGPQLHIAVRRLLEEREPFARVSCVAAALLRTAYALVAVVLHNRPNGPATGIMIPLRTDFIVVILCNGFALEAEPLYVDNVARVEVLSRASRVEQVCVARVIEPHVLAPHNLHHTVQCLGFRDLGVGCRVSGVGCRCLVSGVRCRV
jgi:hypothetical protein